MKAQTIFHGYYDANYAIARTQATPVLHKYVTLTRELSYRFYSHFHPYVAELVRRLIEKSVLGVQAVDTEYVSSNNDGTLVVLPDSTLVALAAELDIELSSGNKLKVSQGTQIYLPDGTGAKLTDGTTVTLPGSMVVTQPRGMMFSLADGSTRMVANGDKLKLSGAVEVRLPGGQFVTLQTGTEVVLLGCKPKPKLYAGIFSPQQRYNPSELVERPYPVKDLDFTSSGAYGVYNWELFYHVPLTIAINLSKNQRFEEAQRWFHYIFDPTDDSDGPTPERYWKVKPFQYTDIKLIEEILVNLSSGTDPWLQEETINSIGAWKDAPFRPHVVARYRQTAYMFKAVMAYLDNILAWGDTLFRQDTGESINEATQLYVLAANILGIRPQAVPKKGSVLPQTYASLRSDLDKFGNALVELETDIPFDLVPYPTEAADVNRFTMLRSLGNALYFCVPHNDKLLGYWDTVADRLFKIRNSLNIQGIFRQLPLFEPPLDPALLAKAAAAGLDVGAIVSGANQPLPLVRFQFLVQKAAEICQEVKSLGNNLLSAIEKEDNEALAILRARHERVILGLAETLKYAQWQEAIKAREGLDKSLADAIQRYTYYERLLGKQDSDIKIPELDALDLAALKKMKFKTGEPEVRPREIKTDIFAGDISIDIAGIHMNAYEAAELGLIILAQIPQTGAYTSDMLSSILGMIPQVTARGTPVGVGGGADFGGEQLSKAASAASAALRGTADLLHFGATMSAKVGSYIRREHEWAFQSNLVAGEITQIFKQLRAAQIREAITEWEWKNHQKQMRNADEIEYFLAGELTDNRKPEANWKKKYTNQSFYAWMKREVKGLYAQCFQFAFDIARKAERALQHELGNPDLSLLQFSYLAGKEGLLAGEKLYLDIKRMEMSYYELNQREYELTKHVSLLQVNPQALLQLRATGRCTVFLPEELFDMDCPGHYFRRIKSVAVSIPCITGPYTGVNCTLTLLKSSIRRSPLVNSHSYTRENADDERFGDYFGSMQSIVTSTGQNDSGLFETNLRDEHYLPFERSGVVSEWQLELPANPSKDDPQQFDYDTIADVILHLRYTAREGGDSLQSAAVSNLKTRIEEAQAVGSIRLFSIRHEFPTEWANFKSAKNVSSAKPAELTLKLLPEHYPFWSKNWLRTVKQVELFVKAANTVEASDNLDQAGQLDVGRKVALSGSLGKLRTGKLVKTENLSPTGPLKLYFGNNTVEDLWLALTWGK